MAVGIGHHHPVDLAPADVDVRRPEGDETVDLCLLITVGGCGKVGKCSRSSRSSASAAAPPRDLRAASR
ncbi:hypothetical protein SHIRM173S_09110 [Streptomyces hirsutus]